VGSSWRDCMDGEQSMQKRMTSRFELKNWKGELVVREERGEMDTY